MLDVSDVEKSALLDSDTNWVFILLNVNSFTTSLHNRCLLAFSIIFIGVRISINVCRINQTISYDRFSHGKRFCNLFSSEIQLWVGTFWTNVFLRRCRFICTF